MTRLRSQSGRGRRRRSFTLVELLIVIGIIVLLLGLTVTVSTGLIRSSEVRQSENALRIIDAAIQEWELVRDEPIRAGLCDDPLVPMDVCFPSVPADPGEPAVVDVGQEVTHELLRVLNRQQSCREIIARVDASFLRPSEDADPDEAAAHPLVLRDPWDAHVIVVFAEILRDPNPAGGPDADGSARTVFEERLGVAVNRRPYLVSAGPDGQFGHLHLDQAEDSLNAQEREDVEMASDNVYSYPVGRERP